LKIALEIFGSVALFLAVIGLYAVNAYTVARRTREIGIRMELGADASATLKMILREGLTLTAVGVGVGMLLAIAVGQVLAAVLYDIHGFKFAQASQASIPSSGHPLESAESSVETLLHSAA
jgi:ABC-type antimicrobial peptide transport system permease subunit